MNKKNNFSRNTTGLVAASLFMAFIVSCNKEISDATDEPQSDILNRTASIESLSNLLWADNIDGSSFFSHSVSVQKSTSYGITAATTHCYQGLKSARFELRNSDPETNGGTRAEISFFPFSANLNRWYAYAIYAPSDKFKYDDEDDVITQWHQGGGETPALCLRILEDRLYMRILGKWHPLGAWVKDRWRSYVMHIKHSAYSDGLIEMWIDGEKVMHYVGANMYKVGDDFDIPNMKFGIYKSTWNGSGTSSTSSRVLYYDDIKMGNQYATYDDMEPTPSGTKPSSSSSGSTTTGMSVTDFKLVNSATEDDVQSISNGQTIDLSALDLEKVNIRAVTSGEVGSVKLELSGQQSDSYTDNRSPFALHGDDGYGNFYYGNWNPPPVGTYTLKATPYSSDNASGTAGASRTITFTIVR
ncbi:polysaccharide lyase [Longitalea luteola]|uniref:polysaccharide lyase n=1 Tax=Longitalea luteola TaxID=2812563 RepID=UPI001A95ACC5|nr:polysaccharide lyase [Longitalea luteola]